MQLGLQIQHAREARGLTKKELAGLVNKTTQSVTWWESGVHKPRPDLLIAIEDALGVEFNRRGEGTYTERRKARPETAIPPEMLRLARVISQLPKPHQLVIESLVSFLAEKSK